MGGMSFLILFEGSVRACEHHLGQVKVRNCHGFLDPEVAKAQFRSEVLDHNEVPWLYCSLSWMQPLCSHSNLPKKAVAAEQSDGSTAGRKLRGAPLPNSVLIHSRPVCRRQVYGTLLDMCQKLHTKQQNSVSF